jgi:phenylacetate-coenzyme A ligase PaaK-like adenylate-forming protein
MSATPFTPFASIRDHVQAEMLRRTPEHLARLAWPATQIAARQRAGLRALVEHAIAHSPFHARRLRGVDAARIDVADLACLPVMTKAEMMDAFDEVVTDRRLDRRLVEQALASTTGEPCPLFGEYVALASGGSSGRRGVFVLDRDALVEFFSSLNRRSVQRMMEQGGPPPGGVTIAMIAAASAVHATGGAPAWMAGQPVRFVPVPVTQPVSDLVAQLNALEPDVLYGYPSAIAVLAREQMAGRLRVAPEAITTSSETLLPEWRAVIREAFGVSIVDTFGSSEGLVGVTAPDDDVLVFNSDVCIVELVDDAGRPVEPGVPSAKILVTNLANRTQPLIRYEITDRFVGAPPVAADGHLRARVDGRSDDVLRWGPTEVHPLVIRSVLVKAMAVEEYQVRQTPRGIALDVVAAATLPLDHLRDQLARALAGAGLSSPEVVTRRVQEIARHPETGKVRRFIAA